ncbi:MAG: SpoIVB peptidase [Oscillospiraceae bacterium]|nr:SpoIVB peptidase [Oscillospiraceae bacterium]
MKKAIINGLFSLVLAAVFTVPAFAEELIVGGQAVGIQISTEGVLVAGVNEVETMDGTASPAGDAGVRAGDIIISIDGKMVYDSASVVEAVDSAGDGPVTVKLRRDDKSLELELQPAESDEGRKMLGLLLRDGMSGIGTLTFFEPDSGLYGALGHSVNDGESKQEMPIRDGSITKANIVSVKAGAAGNPGELNGAADLSQVLGSIEKNTGVGIFGRLYTNLEGQLMETGAMTAGPASIVSTVSGNERREYSIEINRVYRESGGTYAMLTVTDTELLSRTGGIVQGMSGSPIIQNGKLVGAVTHVFVNDPTRGYGIFIENMLDAAENGVN